MNKRTKGYLIISYLVFPFAGVLYSLFNFENKTARNLLAYFGFAFLGFTALQEGDLERYAANYYLKQHTSLAGLFNDLISFNSGKFIIDILASLTGFINNHHFYFSILYIIFGYYLIKTLGIFFIRPFKRKSLIGKLLLISFVLYFSIRNSLNFAFYCGTIFYLYYLTKYIFTNQNKKYLLLSCLAPLFHIGLAALLIANLFFYFSKKTSYPLIFLVIVTFAVSQSQVVNNFGILLTEQIDSSLISSKYDSYVSEEGQEYMNKRYEKGELTSNIKLKVLNQLRYIAQFIIFPLGLFLIWVKRKVVLTDNISFLLFNAALALWSVSNLMLNISQGNRYMFIHTFIIFGLFVYLYQKFKLPALFYRYLIVSTPILFLYGLGSLYASNKLISSSFFVSNFFIEFYLNK